MKFFSLLLPSEFPHNYLCDICYVLKVSKNSSVADKQVRQISMPVMSINVLKALHVLSVLLCTAAPDVCCRNSALVATQQQQHSSLGLVVS